VEAPHITHNHLNTFIKPPKIYLPENKTTRGVSHYSLAIYIKKYLKAKKELGKLKYFTMQKQNLQKIL
jgi:hypothetical protein